MIHILLFGSLRERIGTGSTNLESSGENTVAQIKAQLIEKGESWSLLGEQQVLCAVNQTISEQGSRVNDGDEIAFFPPVTGG